MSNSELRPKFERADGLSPEGLPPGHPDAPMARRAAVSVRQGGGAAESHATCDDAPLDGVVLRVNAICKTATLNFALSVGRVIIESLYGGRLDLWRTRDPGKEQSVRRVARHPRLAMSPAALYRSIAIYELCERLESRSWKHISTTHMRLVLPLAPEQQAALLREAEMHRWSVRRLDQEVGSLAASSTARAAHHGGGRKRASRLHQTIRQLKRSVEAVEGLIEAVDVEMSPESARASLEMLGLIRNACRSLETRVAQCVSPSPTSPESPKNDA
ncbi:MAG: hypothetical protein M3O36_16565 [Myxococcota bacterium]|nr:hypothetical protein [Myxococcota bacterium]